MSPEDQKYLVPTNYIPTDKEDNSSQLPGQIVGGAIATGLGAGAIAGGKAFNHFGLFFRRNRHRIIS